MRGIIIIIRNFKSRLACDAPDKATSMIRRTYSFISIVLVSYGFVSQASKIPIIGQSMAFPQTKGNLFLSRKKPKQMAKLSRSSELPKKMYLLMSQLLTEKKQSPKKKVPTTEVVSLGTLRIWRCFFFDDAKSTNFKMTNLLSHP